MKKVLIIAYYFATNSIGAVRLRGLAKYFNELLWEPTILTINSAENSIVPYRIIEAEYDGLLVRMERKINKPSNVENEVKSGINKSRNIRSYLKPVIRLGREVFAYPDLQKYWYENAVKEGSKLLGKEDFHAIISSSPPVTSHMVAKELKKRFGIPWIADLRDLWTQNQFYDDNNTLIRKFFEKRLEIKTLKNADILTTTTPSSAQDLKKLHRRKHIYPIFNGFDEDIKIEKVLLSDKLNITYAGKLYSGKRDPKLLFRALNELDAEKRIKISEFSIDFYAPVQRWLIEEIQKYGLEDVVKLHGMIPREEVLKKQRETQILLLLFDHKEQNIVPAKIFEYFAASRPILSIGPSEGPVKDLIESTKAGIHLSKIKDVKTTLERFYDEFKSEGMVRYRGIPEEINKYSQREMAKKFVCLLDEII